MEANNDSYYDHERISKCAVASVCPAEIESAHRDGRIASLIGVEGGHSLGSSLAILRTFYQLGARYLTLTHACNTPWSVRLLNIT